MPYLIDGHNLIGQLPDIALDDPNDEAKLVQRLIGFAARTRKKIVIIFDQGLPGGYSGLSTHSVKVIFAAAHQTNADKIMAERIRSIPDPANWTVVSSDREILSAAQTRGMRPMSAAQFAHSLRRPPTIAPDPSENPNPIIKPEDIDEWLRLFGAESED